MSDTIIQVENLSKKYIIGHQQQERYTALRDVLANSTKSFLKNIRNPKLKLQSSQKEDFWSLKDVSFEIKQGDRVGIIGRNGAGKSTLLKILSRITEPTSGRISIKGRVASLLEVGTGFHPELTGRENIYLNGAILGMGKEEIKRKFDEIVDFAEVEKFLDTPVKHYSSGMYVRLAFAVAAHLEPEILIVDEVLAVGDAKFQKKCLGKMEDVGKEGKTIIFVSHSMTTIERLCQSAIMLDKGQVSISGTTTEVVQAYLNENEGINSCLYWERSKPPKNSTYLRKIYLGDENGDNIQYVTTASSLKIIIEYVTEGEYRNFFLSLDLLDNKGELIFTSNSKDVGKTPPDNLGEYHVIVSLPQEILLANTYGIIVNLWSYENGMIDCIDDFRFSVAEVASSSNTLYSGKPGKLFVPCKWQINSMAGYKQKLVIN